MKPPASRPSAEEPVSLPEAGEWEEDLIVPVELSDTLDLHGFSPQDVPELLTNFLEEAQRNGRTYLRIIHGRGMGVLRARVRAQLARDTRVAAFGDAPEFQGGWGATWVELLVASPAAPSKPL